MPKRYVDLPDVRIDLSECTMSSSKLVRGIYRKKVESLLVAERSLQQILAGLLCRLVDGYGLKKATVFDVAQLNETPRAAHRVLLGVPFKTAPIPLLCERQIADFRQIFVGATEVILTGRRSPVILDRFCEGKRLPIILNAAREPLFTLNVGNFVQRCHQEAHDLFVRSGPHLRSHR